MHFKIPKKMLLLNSYKSIDDDDDNDNNNMFNSQPTLGLVDPFGLEILSKLHWSSLLLDVEFSLNLGPT